MVRLCIDFSLNLRLGRAGVERAIVKMLRVLFLGQISANAAAQH
jgi:hypothetical protein